VIQEVLPFTPDGCVECICGRHMLADRRPHWHEHCSDWCFAVRHGIVPDTTTAAGKTEHYAAMQKHGLGYWSDKIDAARERLSA